MNHFLPVVPQSVNLNGSTLPVHAAVFLPGGHGLLDSHVVIYSNGKGKFNVHYLVHDDDAQRSTLHQGSYDLEYLDAITEMERRVRL